MTLRRGDVVWARFDPAEGSELVGTRPAVVVQNDVGNRYSKTTIVAGVTTRFAGKDYPVLVRLPNGALRRASAVNCAQVRTIDVARITGGPVARLDAATMRRVDEALKASLGLAH